MGGSTTTTNRTSTAMPILSEEWKKTFGNAVSNLNSNGATAQQQPALDYFANNMGHSAASLLQGPAGAPNIDSNNAAIQWTNHFVNANVNPAIQSIANNAYKPFVHQAVRQQDPAAQANAALSANAPSINSQTGASFMNAYKNPWDQEVINASAADYNVNADRSLNSMRAGRDASGAFGDRAAIADAVFQADAARGLGSMVSGLRQQGFNTAVGFGQQDANRFLSADQSNASNVLANNQFNASAQNAANQFNANALNDRNQFNVNAGYQGDQQRMQAGGNLINAVGQMAANAQQALNNTMAGNEANMQANLAAQGLNMDAANALMMGGGMTQDQLVQLANLAQAANGEMTNGTETIKKGGGGPLGFMGDVAKMYFNKNILPKIPGLPCWVAREVYGVENPRWLDFRDWLTWKAPRWLFRLYWKHGEKFAAWIKDKPKLKAVIRAMMEWCLK
jgi:hypothetical protein